MSEDNDFDWYEKIQNYIEGSLGQEEKKRFEAEMKANTALKEEVKIYKNISAIFEEETEDVKNLRKTLRDMK